MGLPPNGVAGHLPACGVFKAINPARQSQVEHGRSFFIRRNTETLPCGSAHESKPFPTHSTFRVRPPSGRCSLATLFPHAWQSVGEGPRECGFRSKCPHVSMTRATLLSFVPTLSEGMSPGWRTRRRGCVANSPPRRRGSSCLYGLNATTKIACRENSLRRHSARSGSVVRFGLRVSRCHHRTRPEPA